MLATDKSLLLAFKGVDRLMIVTSNETGDHQSMITLTQYPTGATWTVGGSIACTIIDHSNYVLVPTLLIMTRQGIILSRINIKTFNLLDPDYLPDRLSFATSGNGCVILFDKKYKVYYMLEDNDTLSLAQKTTLQITLF